ncbi:AAA family ATPase [Desulfamplus magnetovallimortis]
MIQSGEFYFISRPRRFGKSLTVSTLKCLFQGQKELFEGLWIAKFWSFKRY